MLVWEVRVLFRDADVVCLWFVCASLKVAMSVSFCLSHPNAVNAFIICSGLCACTEM